MKATKKKIGWGIVFVLVVAVGILCQQRWDVWFGNKPEPSYELGLCPQRVILTFGNQGEFSRNVSWVCGGHPQSVGLEYTRVGSGDTLVVSGFMQDIQTGGGHTCASWASLGTLQPEATYAYRVRCDSLVSEWYSLTMQPDTTRNFTFVYIGDVQDTLNGAARTLFDDVRRRVGQPAFYAFAGDLIERPMNLYWEEAYASIDSIAVSTPLIVSPGNHEYRKELVRKLEARFPHAFSYLLHSQYEGNNVFALDYKDATIITLDTNRDPWLQFSQRRWLKNVLAASHKKWKIVMLHHPLYSIKKRFNNLAVRWLYDDLLRDYGVDLVLQGHEHNYARMTAKSDEGEMETPVYLVSTAAPKNYRLHFNSRYDRFGSGHRFYQTVEVGADTLSVRAYLEDGFLYDEVHVVKSGDETTVVDNAHAIPQALENPQLKGKKAERYRKDAEEWLRRSAAEAAIQ